MDFVEGLLEKKKILVVDDSALMRRVLCDIINSDKRFQVVAKATDGVEAFDLLSRGEIYDAVVLDINMPRMNGLELLKELRKFKIWARIMIASTDSKEGASVTLDALELGALDFIQKPITSYECRSPEFMAGFLDTLYAVACSRITVTERPRVTGDKVKPVRGTDAGIPKEDSRDGERFARKDPVRQPAKTATAGQAKQPSKSMDELVGKAKSLPVGNGLRKIVAIACSTGGPRALQSVIPKLPQKLDAPVILVQHMPKGFTASLAERLDGMSDLTVKEAQEGDVLEKGVVYISMGGQHMNVKLTPNGRHVIHYSDEPSREGVKPSANYMYESLSETKFTDILCVVLTGMGADGMEGIQNLKKKKDIVVLTQNQNSCVVYGMPKSVVNAGLSDQELDLSVMADRIAERIGTKQ